MSLIKEMKALLAESKAKDAGLTKTQPNLEALEFLTQVANHLELTEASEIEVSELPKAKKDALDKITQRFGMEVANVWEGIHGTIFDLTGSSRTRFAKDDLVFLTKLPGFRWMQAETNQLSVGI
jgi:hypothetical protein